jgi:phosphonate transport system ATP-binding protein
MGRLDRHSSIRNIRELLWPASATLDEIAAILTRVDLAEALRQTAGSLSGGQAQRASVARALYSGRPIALGDEPVSALDRRQGGRVLEEIAATHPTSVLALHDVTLALACTTRIVALENGRIALDAPSKDLTAADLARFYEPAR